MKKINCKNELIKKIIEEKIMSDLFFVILFMSLCVWNKLFSSSTYLTFNRLMIWILIWERAHNFN